MELRFLTRCLFLADFVFCSRSMPRDQADGLQKAAIREITGPCHCISAILLDWFSTILALIRWITRATCDSWGCTGVTAILISRMIRLNPFIILPMIFPDTVLIFSVRMARSFARTQNICSRIQTFSKGSRQCEEWRLKGNSFFLAVIMLVPETPGSGLRLCI